MRVRAKFCSVGWPTTHQEGLTLDDDRLFNLHVTCLMLSSMFVPEDGLCHGNKPPNILKKVFVVHETGELISNVGKCCFERFVADDTKQR